MFLPCWIVTDGNTTGGVVVAPRSESVSFLLFSSIELLLSLVTAVLGLTLITCDIYTCNAIHNINVEMKQ